MNHGFSGEPFGVHWQGKGSLGVYGFFGGFFKRCIGSLRMYRILHSFLILYIGDEKRPYQQLWLLPLLCEE